MLYSGNVDTDGKQVLRLVNYFTLSLTQLTPDRTSMYHMNGSTKSLRHFSYLYHIVLNSVVGAMYLSFPII